MHSSRIGAVDFAQGRALNGGAPSPFNPGPPPEGPGEKKRRGPHPGGCVLLIHLTEHPFPAVRFVCGRKSIPETAAAYEFAQYRSRRNLRRRYIQKVVEELQQSFGLSVFGHRILSRRHRPFCSKTTATVSCLGLPDTPKAAEIYFRRLRLKKTEAIRYR